MQDRPYMNTGRVRFTHRLNMLVYCFILFDVFRVSPKRQGKARSAGNGKPFSRTATQHWRFRETPVGQGDKRPSALLR